MTIKVAVNYSYRTYDEQTLILAVDSIDEIGEDEVRDALAVDGFVFSEDEELAIDDFEEVES